MSSKPPSVIRLFAELCREVRIDFSRREARWLNHQESDTQNIHNITTKAAYSKGLGAW